ncbi:Arginase/deacetylase [Hymenopellis radicata]|nr:Arginase/deacetylase [Hymenopellis radicata]
MEPHRAAVILQDACYKHQYIRSKDLSQIVERPERIRAVKVGLAAALSRLESPKSSSSSSDDQDLVAALDRLKIGTESGASPEAPVKVIRTAASLDILQDPAVKFIHGDVNGDVHAPRLKKLAEESWNKIANGESEIPEGLSQGDLYLCPESILAMDGALGAVCEAVDTVMTRKDGISRAFALIRPPGHHCGEDTPEGFCFVNNVAVAAAHGHLKHSTNRVVIFDIDLHHGNGTQSIVWQINEESYRKTLESEGGAPNVEPGPRIYYGSIHDVLSYPCEDGKPHLVQAASVSLHGSHGQYIENVHLQTYESEAHFFDELYARKYRTVFDKAQDFLDSTGGPGDDVLFFISCGMDACEHEYESMSRHNRKVPTAFYHRFTRDACAMADRYSRGRLVTVLEGGYSDLALISGTMAHVLGLTTIDVDEEWWSLDNLQALEKLTKKRRGGKQSLGAPWIERAGAILSTIDEGFTKWSSPVVPMKLRDRPSRRNSPAATPQKGKAPPPKQEAEEDARVEEEEDNESPPLQSKKLPKVILRLGPDPSS